MRTGEGVWAEERDLIRNRCLWVKMPSYTNTICFLAVVDNIAICRDRVGCDWNRTHGRRTPFFTVPLNIYELFKIATPIFYETDLICSLPHRSQWSFIPMYRWREALSRRLGDLSYGHIDSNHMNHGIFSLQNQKSPHHMTARPQHPTHTHSSCTGNHKPCKILWVLLCVKHCNK